MADPAGPGRRYCSVCGYLSSEPVLACPRCTLSTSHVPQVAAPMPVAYAAEWPSRAASRGPPAWIVLGLLLALIIVVIVVTLAVDGVFNAAPGELLSPPLTWAALPRWA